MNLCLQGALLGDIAGSWIEFDRPPWYDSATDKLFNDYCHYTDDSVLSLAVKDCLINSLDPAETLRKYVAAYPCAGYGPRFHKWANNPTALPYGSYGNGAAMRISYLADWAVMNDWPNSQILDERKKITEITHNHLEGIRGAECLTKICVCFLRATNPDRTLIQEFAKEYHYSVDTKLDVLRPTTVYDVSCQGSLPLAIRCFMESCDYKSCLRNVLSFKCDTNTVAAIAGAIAAAYYKKTMIKVDEILEYYLPEELFKLYSI